MSHMTEANLAKKEYNRAYRAKNRARLNDYDRQYRKKNQIKRILHSRRWRIENPAKRLLDRARSSSRIRGWEFVLTENDILPLPTTCPILGIPLSYHLGPRTDATASIDRIDNSKGYIAGNVQIISWRANIVKGNATMEELYALAEWVLKPLGD